MNKRLVKALGVAALGIAATGLFIPQAAADSVTHLAPGVDCEEWQCTNNTNDEYQIEYDAHCLYTGTAEVPHLVDHDDSTLILPHKQGIISPSCPPESDKKGNVVDGVPFDVYYRSAQVDNVPPLRLPTGSAH
ncbi:hypothetical protein [Nocardia alni]|uniref:hypothetical protein n=1 Tax=Nocardia alni TaxID=2815723 RepID=UPI001C2229C8|nr:hypothetical protein [Nocardia alni]